MIVFVLHFPKLHYFEANFTQNLIPHYISKSPITFQLKGGISPIHIFTQGDPCLTLHCKWNPYDTQVCRLYRIEYD